MSDFASQLKVDQENQKIAWRRELLAELADVCTILSLDARLHLRMSWNPLSAHRDRLEKAVLSLLPADPTSHEEKS